MTDPSLELSHKPPGTLGYSRSNRLLWAITWTLPPLLLLVFAGVLLYAGTMRLFHSPRFRAVAPEK